MQFMQGNLLQKISQHEGEKISSVEDWTSLVQEKKWLILGFVCWSRYRNKLSKTFAKI